jgi:hypothetical protein
MTMDAAPEPAAVQPPETPLEPSGTPSESPPAQAPAVTDPVELAKQAVASIDDETLGILVQYLPAERKERLFGEEIERSAQSRAGRSESDAELQLHALDDQGTYLQGLTALKTQVKEFEGGDPLLEKASDLGADLMAKLDDRYIENALRRHPVHKALTPEDERKLASARGETERLNRVRGILGVYLDRAQEAGQAPAAVRKQVEAELGVAERLLKVAEAFKGAANAPPSPEAAIGALNLQAWNSMSSEAREAYKKGHSNWREEVDAATSTYLASRR